MKTGLYFDYKESWMMVSYDINNGNCNMIDYFNACENDFDMSYELMKLKTDKFKVLKFDDYDDIMKFEEENNTEILCLNEQSINKLLNM